MTATELAAVIVTISSVAAAVVLVFGLIAVNRTLKQLRDAVDELRTETASVVAEIRDTVYAANYELNRVDELLAPPSPSAARSTPPPASPTSPSPRR
jgi:hypothetical protein